MYADFLGNLEQRIPLVMRKKKSVENSIQNLIKALILSRLNS